MCAALRDADRCSAGRRKITGMDQKYIDAAIQRMRDNGEYPVPMSPSQIAIQRLLAPVYARADRRINNAYEQLLADFETTIETDSAIDDT